MEHSSLGSKKHAGAFFETVTTRKRIKTEIVETKTIVEEQNCRQFHELGRINVKKKKNKKKKGAKVADGLLGKMQVTKLSHGITPKSKQSLSQEKSIAIIQRRRPTQSLRQRSKMRLKLYKEAQRRAAEAEKQKNYIRDCNNEDASKVKQQTSQRREAAARSSSPGWDEHCDKPPEQLFIVRRTVQRIGRGLSKVVDHCTYLRDTRVVEEYYNSHEMERSTERTCVL